MSEAFVSSLDSTYGKSFEAGPETLYRGEAKNNIGLCKWLIVLCDTTLILLVEFLYRRYACPIDIVYYTFDNGVAQTHSTGIDPFLVTAGSCIVYLFLSGHYSQRRPLWDELRPFTATLAFAFVVDTAILAGSGAHGLLLPSALGWLLLYLGIPVARILLKRQLLRLGLWQVPTVIIGTGNNARQTAIALLAEPMLGFKPELFLTLAPTPEETAVTVSGTRIPVQSVTPSLLQQLQEASGIHIVLAVEEDEMAQASALLNRLAVQPTLLDVVPPVRGLPLYGLEVNHLFARDLLLLRARNNLARRAPRLLKRMLDLVGSAVLIVALSPVFLVLGLLVLRTGRPILYGHQRVGQKGRHFRCLKFRTMVPNAEQVLAELLARDPQARAEWERDFKLKDDPRITPVGRFLRRTSLDELPQLFNVLRGDMSLVGPRPIVSAEQSRYGDALAYYLLIKPGITGLWQISGRSDTNYDRRVFLDAWYVKNWSLWYDLTILLRTVAVVLKKQGAY